MKQQSMLLGVLSFILSHSLLSQTILQTGDIAIIGIDTDDEEFLFTTLVELQSGTEIYFSDEEPLGQTISGSGEGILLYTAPVDIAAGTLIAYSSTNPDFIKFEGSFTLANSGDGITAFQGYNSLNDSAGTFLFQLGKSSSHLGSANGLTPSEQVILGSDNGVYNGPRSGSKSSVYAEIGDVTNYTTSGSALPAFDTSLFMLGLIWDGIAWSNGTGPIPGEHVLISGSGNSGSFSCGALTIATGASLGIDSTSTVTISGDITNNGNGINGNGELHLNNNTDTIYLLGNSISFGGLISINGNTVLHTNDSLKLIATSASSFGQITGTGSVSGIVEIESFLQFNDGRYFHLGSPLEDAVLQDFCEAGSIINSSFGANGSAWEWDASSANWIPAANGDLNSTANRGKAYAIYAGQSGSFGPFLRLGAGIISLKGRISNQDAVVPLHYHHGQNSSVSFAGGTDTGSTEGWNLIANPFGAILDWDQQSLSLPAAMSSAIYVSNGSNYLVYNNGAGSGSPYISPFQGFFVQLTDSGTTQMIFDADYRNPGANAVLMKTSNKPDGVDILVENLQNGAKDELFIGFESGSTDGYDPQWDAHKLMNATGVPNLYVWYDSTAYSICRVPSNERRAFPLQLNFANDGSLLTISATTAELQSYQDVILEDHLSGSLHPLNHAPFSFTHDTSFSQTRFTLHFDHHPSSITKVSGVDDYAWSSGDLLNISSTRPKGQDIEIYDMTGRQLAELKSQPVRTVIPFQRTSRLLIIKIGDGEDSSIIKLIH